MMTYPFTLQDSEKAYEEWGANCGPNALAFAARLHIDDVRGAIPGFEEKRYTSPSMMAAALDGLGLKYRRLERGSRCGQAEMFTGPETLVRVQWCGPWTAPGSLPKWAYRQTHWIATWLAISQRNESERARMVFDVNGGIRTFESWMREIVPILTSQIKRADGMWFPTHAWVLN